MYARKGETGVFTGVRNSSTGSVPTATKTGNVFTGWYLENTKVINSNGTIVSSIPNLTDSNGNWLITEDKTLIAGFTPSVYAVEIRSGNLLENRQKDLTTNVLLYNDGITDIIATDIQWGGVAVPQDVFEEGATYILSYDIQKISGTLVNIGGHSVSAVPYSFKIDGENSTFPYISPVSNMSSKNDNNVEKEPTVIVDTSPFKERDIPLNQNQTIKNIFVFNKINFMIN